MITWRNPQTNPPPLNDDILIAVRGEAKAAEAFRIDANEYMYSTGHPVDAVLVYAWAEMPDAPQIPKGGGRG